MKKKLVIKAFFSFLLFLIVLNNISSMAITPAKVEFDFEPNFETQISYKADAGNPQIELEIFTQGDLSEYITLDKTRLVGGGEFTLALKLPSSFEIPGPHETYVGIREIYNPEIRGGGMVGTTVIIFSRFIVNVPYPGKWIDVNLQAHDVNVNEPVNFILNVKSQGDQEVSVKPRIEIYSISDEYIQTLSFNEYSIASQESLDFTKSFDTTKLNAGTYKAVAVVDYDGKNATDNESFRIGELVINVINYTQEIIIDKIQAFNIGVESGWNDEIDGAYADVSILDTNYQILTQFKTSSTSLIPWENRTITGYFDTSNFTAGNYSANITLIYYGKDVGKSSSEIVTVKFIEKPNNLLIIMGVIVIVVLIISIVIWRYLRKNAKRKK